MPRVSKEMRLQREELLRIQGLSQISGNDASRLLQGRYTDLRNKTILGDIVVQNMGTVFEKVIDLSGTVICGSLKFLGNLPDNGEADRRISKMSIKGLLISGSRIFGDVDLSRVVLEDVADFDNAVIDGNLDLGCSHIRKCLDIQNTLVRGNALVDGLVVDCSVVASGIVVCGSLGLQGTTIRQNLNFERALIKGDMSLANADIGGRAFLVAAQFGGSMDLSCAVVRDVLDLGGTNVVGNLDLSGAILNGLNFCGLEVSEGIIVDEKMAQLVHFSAPNIPLMVKTNENIHF